MDDTCLYGHWCDSRVRRAEVQLPPGSTARRDRLKRMFVFRCYRKAGQARALHAVDAAYQRHPERFAQLLHDTPAAA